MSSEPSQNSVTVPATPTTKQRRPRTMAPVGTLFHPKSGDGIVTKDYYTRVTLGGKRENFPLGTDERTAQRLDRELRARLIAGHTLEDVKNFVAEQLGRETTPSVAPVAIAVDPSGDSWATIGDLFKVRATYRFTAHSETIRQYEFCLLNMIELALSFRADREAFPPSRSGKRVQLSDYQHILDLPSSVLTEDLVDEFQQARVLHAECEGRDAMSARITANTELRQARAVFTRRACIAYRRAKLRLPDLTQFLQAPVLEKTRRALTPPHEDTINGLHAALRNIRNDEPLFLIIALALFAGLRRGEILHAHPRWLQTTTGPSLVLRFGNGFTTKNGEERTIPIPRWLYDRLLARGGDYFVTALLKDRKAALVRAVAWVRANGLAHVGKPLHALRGLVDGYLITTVTQLTARKRLGHRDIRTTLEYYADTEFCPEIARLWEEDLSGIPFPIAA